MNNDYSAMHNNNVWINSTNSQNLSNSSNSNLSPLPNSSINYNQHLIRNVPTNQINSLQNSFSSDQSINLSSDYTYNSSSSSISSNNNIVSSSINNHLLNQISMVNAISTINNVQKVNKDCDQVKKYSSTKSSALSNQNSIKTKNTNKSFGFLSTPGKEKNRVIKKKGKQVAYKHVPHREKPPHLVAKRNARERHRVEDLNKAFSNLRNYIPIENKNKRTSKAKTLRLAIEYIQNLEKFLHDSNSTPNSTTEQIDFSDFDFKMRDLENESDENSQSTYENNFLDDTSQQSSQQLNNFSLNNYNQINYQDNSNMSQNNSDSNNNLVENSNQENVVFHISNNSSYLQNAIVDSSTISYNQPTLATTNILNFNVQTNSLRNHSAPIQSSINKENILFENSENFNPELYAPTSYN